MTGQPLPGWGPLRSRTVSWYDPAATSNGTAGRTGLAFLQAIVDGQLPGPPIASLFDFRIDSVVEGEIVVSAAAPCSPRCRPASPTPPSKSPCATCGRCAPTVARSLRQDGWSSQADGWPWPRVRSGMPPAAWWQRPSPRASSSPLLVSDQRAELMGGTGRSSAGEPSLPGALAGVARRGHAGVDHVLGDLAELDVEVL